MPVPDTAAQSAIADKTRSLLRLAEQWRTEAVTGSGLGLMRLTDAVDEVLTAVEHGLTGIEDQPR